MVHSSVGDLHPDSPRIGISRFASRTTIIPTAAEFAEGQNVRLYDDLAKRLTKGATGPAKKYPEASGETKEGREQRRDYWLSFVKHYDSRVTMAVIEDAATKYGRISWIDFRIPLDAKGETLHLHIVPAGSYDAGVFGYNFVRRGSRHGIRIVGTLKSKLDLNVMAIYDK